jgi:heme-degrading monooxygenase HmoA
VSVVKINVLTVTPELRGTLEQRFAARAGAVEAADGFEWFELLRPVEGTDDYLVYTRWRDEAAFEAWRAGQAHGGPSGQAHGGPSGAPGGPASPTGPTGPASPASPASPAGPTTSPTGGTQAGGPPPGGPAASAAELWSFEVVQSAGPAA